MKKIDLNFNEIECLFFSGRQLVGQMRNQNPEMFEAAAQAAAQAGLGGLGENANPNTDGSNNPEQQPPPST